MIKTEKNQTELNNLYDLLFSKNITKNEYFRLRELEEIEIKKAKVNANHFTTTSR